MKAKLTKKQKRSKYNQSSEDNLNHFVQWDTSNSMYVKCKDGYGNRPTPQTKCSIVVKAHEKEI